MTLLGDLMYLPAEIRSRKRAESKELSFILRGRGFGHNSVDALHPLPDRPEESLPLSYIETVRNGNFANFTPDTSGQSSPTTDNTLSLANGLSESNTWSTNTGILTGRSSVYSWGNEDEFDRQASATVKHMFDEIDGMLFEGKHFNGSPQLLSECEEWFKRFPHLRICGYQLLNSKDDGTQLIPFPAGDPRVFSQRPQTSVLEDVEEFGVFDSQSLYIKGCHLDPLLEPPESYMNDEMNGYYTEFEEEVLAEDGEVVEYFGYDQPAVEEEGTAESSTGVKYRRQQRRGYPPVTPNACAKDAVVSQLFDQAWGEVVLWLRDLLSLYSQKVLRDKPQFLADVVSSDRIIESPLRPYSQSVMSRNIFSSQARLKPFPSFNPPLDPSSLSSAMKVQTARLNPRAPSATTSHALDSRDTETPFPQGRPASSRSINSQFLRGFGGHSSESFIFKNTPFRKNRNLPSLQRSNHLEGSKPKTPSSQDDVMSFIQGRRLFTEKERLPSPPQAHSNSPAPNTGKIVLPPIDGSSYRETPVHQNGGRSSAKQVSFRQSRASSAATDDSRQSLKDKTRNFAEPRPSTTAATHSLRNDNLAGRRLSTPMGTYTAPLGMYTRGQTRHSHGQSPLTLHGVSMSISSHPATEANASSLTSSYSQQYEGRGISPISDEEYEVIKSPGPSNQHSQRRSKLVPSIR